MIKHPFADKLDYYFPKGDKARGKALALYSYLEIARQNEREEVLKEVEKKIDECEGKGKTHGFRNKWIDANELKKSLKEQTK